MSTGVLNAYSTVVIVENVTWKSTNDPRLFKRAWEKQRVRKLESHGSHNAHEWRAILKRHKSRCAICDVFGKMTKDHIIPLSRGGTDFAYNLQPLCMPCNSRKFTRIDAGAQHSLFDRIGELRMPKEFGFTGASALPEPRSRKATIADLKRKRAAEVREKDAATCSNAIASTDLAPEPESGRRTAS